MSQPSVAEPFTERPVFALKSKPAILDSYEAALATARELAPKFRSRVAEGERMHRLPDENVAELIESGLIHLMLPRKLGGSELGLDALLDVTGIISEVCPSTGWVHALWGAHMWLAALYPADVQQDMWSNPRSLMSSVVNTKGDPTRVEGGYLWTGSGAFSSGVSHCNWLSPALNVPKADGSGSERKWLLIPRSAIEIVDDWRTMGLKGTGSNTIVAKDVFIPEQYAVSAADMGTGMSPGALMYKHNSQYSAAGVCIFTPPLAATALGAARGFLAAFDERMRGRLSSADPMQIAEQSGTLIRFARAAADMDAARALLIQNARTYSMIPAPDVDDLTKAKCRRDQAYCAQLSREAANSLWESAGGGALFDTSDVQRLWRDTNAAAAHHGLFWDAHGLSWARTNFALPTGAQTGIA